MLTNILAGLSLILALATGMLWGRSYWVCDILLHKSAMYGRGYEEILILQSSRGLLMYDQRQMGGFGHGTSEWKTGSNYFATSSPFTTTSGSRKCFIFRWESFPSSNQKPRQFSLSMSYGALLLASSILPALRGWQLLRARKRQSENLCPQCGYDLRATPERCPECGRETPTATKVILK
jgi:hypothetical protein